MRAGTAKGWIAIGLVAATLAAFAPAFEAGFVNYDTPRVVTKNPALEHGLSPEGLAWAFRTNLIGNWQPLTALSYLLDYELFGLEPAGYHATNVLLHALAALLFFAVWTQMTGAVWRSGFVAALFALHPAHVESVAWVAERKDVLSAVFWALTMMVYGRAVRSGSRRALYGGVPLVFALGLMAKPMLVTLPFVLLLLDDWPLDRLRARVRREGRGEARARRGGARAKARADADDAGPAVGPYDGARVRGAVLEKLPLFALSAVFSVVTLVFQREAGAMGPGNALAFGLRVQNALLSYAHYVGDLFWPVGLAVFYPFDTSPSRLAVLGAAVGLVAATALVLRALPRHRYLAVGWLWYLGTLVPVIGLVQVGAQAHADRYTYLPFVGLGVALAWGVPELAARLRLPRRAPAVAAAAALVALSLLTVRQAGFWRSSFTLFEHALAVTEGNALAQHQLATAYWEERRLEPAAEHYRAALRVQPGRPSSVLGLGTVRLTQERYEEAREHLGGLLDASDPEIVRKARIALGNAAGAQGFYDRALRHYRAALRAGFDRSAANNLAWLLATHPDPTRREPAEALRLAEAAADAVRDGDPQVLDTLAAAAAAAGDFERALAVSDRALALARQRGDAELADMVASHRRHYREGRPLPGP